MKRSSLSAKITFLDEEGVRKALREYLGELARSSPEVLRVVAFGSFANGTAVPSSDLDLLLEIEETNQRFLDRIPRYTPVRFPIGVDVFPYTESELSRMRGEGNRFVRMALERGIEVYKKGTPDLEAVGRTGRPGRRSVGEKE